MENLKIPTSRDIYLEADGKKIAVVQGYRLKAERTTAVIEEFGNETPVAAIGGKMTYTIELSRIVPMKNSFGDGIDFYSLSDFNLVVVKPDRRIVYSGCQWTQIQETGSLGVPCVETAVLTASRRMVLE
ncbi:MAG: hypothetical protein ACOX60_04800 [Massiliimalia sp.]